jgi:hypothetical protein
MLEEIATTSSLMFCFKPTVVPGFFSYTFLLRYPLEEEVLQLGTLVPMNIEVLKKYPLESRQNRCFLNTSPQQSPNALQTSAPWQLKCFESR